MNKTNQIINLLFQVDKAIHEQLRDAEVKYPLSLPDLMALSYIELHDTASVSDMAAHFGVRKSSISAKLTKLEKQGLLKKKVSAVDRRSQCICLTKKATDLITETKKHVLTHASPLLDKLTETEKETFIQLLKKIIV